MIEFCTKKRMVLAVVVLTGISVIALVAESYVSQGPNSLSSAKSTLPDNNTANNSGACPEKKVSSVIKECAPCSVFEKKLHSEECGATGYGEIVVCSNKATVFRSCPKIGPLEEKKFFIFEGLSCAVGLASYGLVFIRRKRLDRLLMEKVHKQIASGV